MSATLAARARTGSTLQAPVKRAGSIKRKPSLFVRLTRAMGRRPGRTLFLLSFSAVSAAIVVNALLFQQARHPAPILSAPTPTQASPRNAETRSEIRQEAPAAGQGVPVHQGMLPPVRPGELSTNPRPPAPVVTPRTAQPAATPAPVATAAARPAVARDPIADLINSTNLRPPADIRNARPVPARRTTVEN